MTHRVLIVADDLTGALDSAVGFADGTRRVIVARTPEAVADALALAPDVLAINTASREIAPEAARARVSRALGGPPAPFDTAPFGPAPFGIMMKKIDSRLKGNLSAETAALAAWAGRTRILACPAIPDMGRVVQAGALCGTGVAAPIPVAARFGAELGARIEAPDAGTDADLDALVAGDPQDTLWIGARGLAFALARRIGVGQPLRPELQGPVLIANGSRDPVTRAQIAALPEDICVIEAPDGRLESAGLEARLSDLAPDAPVVLTITDGGGDISGAEAARRLADATVTLAARRGPRSLILCGGESAQAALDHMGIASLAVLAELRPGLPLCRIDSAWGPVQMVTKSGGFGDAGLLCDLVVGTNAGQMEGAREE